MQQFDISETIRPLNREQQIRNAILLTFRDPLPEAAALLRGLSDGEWNRLLPWLDTSGVALYFIERMMQLELCNALPTQVVSRLQQNLMDNQARTEDMVAESAAIHRGFQAAGLSYATLKGFSLCPVSVPRPELRSQLDLDFLIATHDAPVGRAVLERRGYRLRGVSGRSWEFLANEVQRSSLEDLYKISPYRRVELHLETTAGTRTSLLGRLDQLYFRGVCMPVLPAVDLFLGQALHLYKHVCEEFSRAAHYVEFRRHVIARFDDHAFWRELREASNNNPRAVLGLGVVTLMISEVMSPFAPQELSSWTVDTLPLPVRAWVELYARTVVLGTAPGSKLYLLLQKQTTGVPKKRSVGCSLFPRRLPPVVFRGMAGEGLLIRILRYGRQGRYILSRLRFHLVEGVRYCCESIRLRQHINRMQSAGAIFERPSEGG